MPTLNPFDNDAFTIRNLSAAIQILPNQYGRLNELGLFSPKGVTTRSIMVESYLGILNLLPTRPVGSPGTLARRGTRNVRSLTIPHIPHDDAILPDEYANIRAFGTENQLMTLAGVMNEHLANAKAKFAITWEFMRWGALKGCIYDGEGTQLYNLFSEFEVQQKSISFALSSSSTEVQPKCFELSRYLEDNLKGEVMSGVRAMVSPEFFDALITHKTVKEAYANYTAAQSMLGGDPRKSFTFAGITFEEHRGVADDVNGTAQKFVPENEGIAFPIGTVNTFKEFYAPADFLETVNTEGQQLYAKQKVKDFDRGVDLHFQSNPLPVCLRPNLLVRLVKG